MSPLLREKMKHVHDVQYLRKASYGVVIMELCDGLRRLVALSSYYYCNNNYIIMNPVSGTGMYRINIVCTVQ